MTNFLAIVLVFGALIAIHEFGHFIAAKRNGVQVDEYAIGFGPLLWSRRKGETLYSLRAIPLGGFCKMAGMIPEELLEGAEDRRDEAGGAAPDGPAKIAPGRAFLDKSVAQRMWIIAAGPLMNFLLAVVLFVVTFAALGLPSEPTLTVDETQQGLPAAEAGLEPGDRILAIDGQTLENWIDLQQTVEANPNRALEFTIDRGGERLALEITPTSQDDGRGYIGLRPRYTVQRFGFIQSVTEGFLLTGSIVVGWFQAVGGLLGGGQAEGVDVMGPVGIASQIGQAAEAGLAYLLFLAAVISANLGLINLLPIPALDGSRLVFLSVEAVRGRPVAPEKENFIHFVGFALLLLLGLLITYRDILRLSTG